MTYVTELSEALRGSNVNEGDRQAILNSLRALAAKGNRRRRMPWPTLIRQPKRQTPTMWKDAEPNIPILKEAKTKYAKLQ